MNFGKTAFHVLVILTAVSARLPAADFDSVVAGIDRYYESISSLRAEFTQLVEVPALEKQETFRGTLYFQKPHFLRLEYEQPEGQLLVADGADWWFYMPQEEIPQAMRAPMDAGNAPVYVLGGNIGERFDGSLVGTEPRGGAECYVLDLVPMDRAAFYQSLRAWVDTSSFATRAIRYVDEGGNFNTFDLSGHEVNVDLSASLFSFRPPPEAQVLEAETP